MNRGSSGAGLYAAKAWYTARLTVFIRMAVRRDISPDVFTAVGAGGGLAAAGLLHLSAQHPHPAWGLAVGLALAIRLAGANLDGAIARARNVARPWGFVLNEIGDRAGDLFPMLVLAHLAGDPWGFIALAGSVMPTFAALSVAAAGGPRANGGPVGKTERCALITIAALVAVWWTPYDVVAALIGFGGWLTAMLRFRAGRRVIEAAALVSS